VGGWLRRTLSSSIGKKLAMAVSGLLLIGFLIVHLSGNLLIFADDQGRAFDEYARKLDDNPLLPIAEIALLALFVVHIALALRVTTENRDARRIGYGVRNSMGAKTLASSTMIVTGSLVLIFLIVHLADFRIGKLFAEARPFSLAAMVRRRLHEPLGAAIYLAGVLALGVHLRHGFRSAFQTLGVNHPKLNPILVRVGWALAVILAAGFAAFPILLLARGGTP
jgi:succinate dehydrogenase / fumarate reductase cytochrome b subunit